MKLLPLAALGLAFALTQGCTLSTIDAGEEGVMTYQPYFFGSGGVDPQPLQAGAAWTAMSTKVDRYDMKPIKVKERFIDLTASDNVAIDFDFYLTLKVLDGQSPLLHEKSGRDWYKNKISDTLRGIVRNEARTKTSIALRTDEKVITETQDQVKELMTTYVKEIGLPVIVVKANIGKVVPPDEVLAEAAQTAAQKQRKQTEDQRKLTEDARLAAETAAALADKAYATEFNMSTEQFLRNKELDIMAQAAKSGNVSLIMNASGAQPMVKVGK